MVSSTKSMGMSRINSICIGVLLYFYIYFISNFDFYISIFALDLVGRREQNQTVKLRIHFTIFKVHISIFAVNLVGERWERVE